ncbi:Crp/Fnr family transcriptional regulator [Deinococcus actinosclerus]|uniref:Cyclic nucleotide-binding domain-containing protein n=1 Tax=Deinococcus actinosclerus TaxID=1768108 RepID=A0ABN4K7H7_9DEIO|nr:Crp/Fnr family transcriptional regulator [Deinococcus actinosclerus]ALW90126.1 hypothetical protein AUC44_15535 [Deinococcus actinosclerus]
MTLPENLRVSPLLRGAAPDTLRQLAAQAASRTLPRTAALWRSGDPVVCAFILLRGEVRLTRPQAGGRSLTRPVSGAGEVLGLRDVLGAADTFAEDAVVSAPHTDLLALPGAALRELVRRDPALAGAALTLLAEQTRSAEARLDLLSAPVPVRLIGYLLERGPHALPTNSALAAQLGTVPELVSRHLGDLYPQGMIGLRRREIVTLDEAGLRRRLPG